MSVNVTCLNCALRLSLGTMETLEGIRFELCDGDQAQINTLLYKNIKYRTAILPLKLDVQTELMIGEKTDNQDLMMRIMDDQGTTTGMVSLYEIDFKNMHCQINFLLDADASTFAKIIEEIKKHCFGKLNLRKISIGLLQGCQMESLLEIAGFEKEATLKQHKFTDGKHNDVVLYSYFSNLDGAR